MRRGKKQLGRRGRSVLQSHTYSGGNTRALMAATEVLQIIPKLDSKILENARCLEAVMKRFELQSRGLFIVQGIGLMWGALVNTNYALFRRAVDPRLPSDTMPAIQQAMTIFKEKCADHNILPYFVPVGGFMVTPLYDIDVSVINTIGDRLCAAVDSTLRELQ
jgi:acetylornithine/succinyldiaminopimelate/putrescine aminotransferase